MNGPYFLAWSGSSREIANSAMDKTPKPSKILSRHCDVLCRTGWAVTLTPTSALVDSTAATPSGELVGHSPIIVRGGFRWIKSTRRNMNVDTIQKLIYAEQCLPFDPCRPGSSSRPCLPELIEQGGEFGIGADRVEIGVRRDFRGTPPAAFEGEAKCVQGAVGVVANQSGRLRGGRQRRGGTGRECESAGRVKIDPCVEGQLLDHRLGDRRGPVVVAGPSQGEHQIERAELGFRVLGEL